MKKVFYPFLFLFFPAFVQSQPVFDLDWVGLLDNQYSSFNRLADLETDSENNVIYAGEFFDPIDLDFSEDIYWAGIEGTSVSLVVKMDASGNVLWKYEFGTYGIGNGTLAYIRDIEVDREDNIICTGEFVGSGDFDAGPGSAVMTAIDDYNSFILKISAEGKFLWVDVIYAQENPSGTNRNHAYTLDTDSGGNIYIGGKFRGMTDFDPGSGEMLLSTTGIPNEAAYVMKVNPHGAFDWIKTYDSYGNDGINLVHVDQQDELVVCGYFYDSLQIQGPYLDTVFERQQPVIIAVTRGLAIKMNTSGHELWARTGDFNAATNLISDSQNNLYLAGQFYNSFTFSQNGNSHSAVPSPWGQPGRDAFLVKLDPAGEFLWESYFGKSYSDNITTLDIKSDNSIFVGGQMIWGYEEDTLYFNSLPVYDTIGGAFVFELDGDGQFVQRNGFKGDSQLTKLAVDKEGALACAGTYITSYSMDYDPDPAVVNSPESGYSGGAFILRMRTEELSDESSAKAILYPNPFLSELIIDAGSKFSGAKICVFNACGAMIDIFYCDTEKTILDTNHFAAGMYIITMEANGETLRRKVLKM